VRQRSISTNAVALIAARIGAATGSIVVATIAARHLGESAFGTYAAVVVGGFVANTIVTFGTDTLIVRSTARDRSNSFVRESIGLQLSLVALMLGSAGLSVVVFGGKAVPVLVQAVGLLPGVWATAATAVLRGRERMDLAAVTTVVGALVGVFGAVVARTLDSSVTGFVAAAVVAQFIVAGMAVALATRVQQPHGGSRAWSPSFGRTLWAKARPFAGMVVASTAAASAGVLSLKLVGDDLATGQYAAANRIAEALRLAPAALFGAAFPAMSRGVHLTTRYRSGVRLLVWVMAAASITTILLADRIIEVVFAGFEDSSVLLRILAIGVLPALARLRWSFELIADGAERLVARLAFVAAAITVVLSVASATVWGPKMVASAFVFGLTIHALLLWDLHRRTIVLAQTS